MLVLSISLGDELHNGLSPLCAFKENSTVKMFSTIYTPGTLVNTLPTLSHSGVAMLLKGLHFYRMMYFKGYWFSL